MDGTLTRSRLFGSGLTKEMLRCIEDDQRRKVRSVTSAAIDDADVMQIRDDAKKRAAADRVDYDTFKNRVFASHHYLSHHSHILTRSPPVTSLPST